MSVVTQLFRRAPEEPPPQTLAQTVHDAAQNLACELRAFRSGWSYFPQLAQLELVISNLPEVLNRLPSELRRNSYASATAVEGDPRWRDRLHKLQEGIARVSLPRSCCRNCFRLLNG